MNADALQPPRLCPVCGAVNALDELNTREYRCAQCRMELAHLDLAANGAVRGVFGWLHPAGDIIVDRYQIKSVLGKGGFGATYLVEDLKLSGKRRALKEVPELLFDEYETALLSRLNHPAIPDIIDRSVVDGMVYLVLEFGGSRTLNGELKRYPDGRIPLATLVPWMRQLCDVLIYLHSQQPPIIHRDLKPDNVLLDEHDRVMLIDFGIAKEALPANLTRTLGRAATQGFSPPEQAMGTGTNERSDIYALAATFYASLTGHIPPAAHERVAGKDLVPPSQMVPGIPPELEAMLLRALDLNVNHRPQSVREFSEVLDALGSSGMDSVRQNSELTSRTVLLGQAPPKTATRPSSIRLPSSRITTGHSTPVGPAEPVDRPRKNLTALVAIAAVVAVVLGGLIFHWQSSEKLAVPAPTVAPAAPYVVAPQSVPSAPPIAQFTATPVPTTPLAINFDASASRDPDGKITTYLWEFGDGTSDNKNRQLVSHTYMEAGTYTAKLTITDDSGLRNTKPFVVTVNRPLGSAPPNQPEVQPSGAQTSGGTSTTGGSTAGGEFGKWRPIKDVKSTADSSPNPINTGPVGRAGGIKEPTQKKRSTQIKATPPPIKAKENWEFIYGGSRKTD